MTNQATRPRKYKRTKEESAQAHRDLVNKRARALSEAVSDIGELPDVVDPERKAKAEASFKFFCETYFTEVFYFAWSPDHEKVIARIERAVLSGDLSAVAMPRGSGKTTLMQLACIWAAFVGATQFVCLIASNANKGALLLANIKVWMETNQLLLDDWPEVIHPIRELEGKFQRCKTQTYQGELTRMKWIADRIVLPTMPKSKASGAVISCSGMKGGEIRGQMHARQDGTIVRPSLVMIDDPQTRDSAASPSQNKDREAILAGDVLGMAGPGRKIAGLMACTVIYRDDMADNILDRRKHPEWRGERTKMVYEFPKNEKLWEKYAEIRSDSMINDGNGSEATEFYRENRKEMDDGAVIAWPERFNVDELSAIQNAMNLKLMDEAAFFAEYQNEPLVDEGDELLKLHIADVTEKINGRKRGYLPVSATNLTAFIDVHDNLLYYCVVAWERNFTGAVVDYGVYPEQSKSYFSQQTAKQTMKAMAKAGADVEGAIHAGLEVLIGDLLGRSWPTEKGGSGLSIEKLFVDCGYKPGIVDNVCRKHKTVAMPYRGVGIKAGQKPMSSYRRKPGEQLGAHWYIPTVDRTREVRAIRADVNYWKTFCHNALMASAGDAGAMTIFGNKKTNHSMFAEHIATSEFSVATEGHGRKVNEWKVMAGRPDNHWFDCLVGCFVGASTLGVKSTDQSQITAPKRKHYTQKDMQRSR